MKKWQFKNGGSVTFVPDDKHTFCLAVEMNGPGMFLFAMDLAKRVWPDMDLCPFAWHTDTHRGRAYDLFVYTGDETEEEPDDELESA